MTRVFLTVDVPEEVAERLREDTRTSVLVHTSYGPVTIAPESAVLAEAGRLLPSWLEFLPGGRDPSSRHALYWLRLAADVAREQGI